MLNLYLLRHGETDWNKIGRFQGWTDIPLNETGRTQARSIASTLKELEFLHCVSSDLGRAQETLSLATENRYPLHQDKRFREIFCGAWEGQTKDTLREQNEHIEKYFIDPLNFPPRDGETLHQLLERSAAALQELLDTYRTATGNILIVSHGGTIRALLTHLMGTGLHAWNSFYINNCGLAHIIIEPTGRKRLALLNGS